MNADVAEEQAPREFRAATPEDEVFIFSSWLRSHHEMGDWPHRLAIDRCILGEGKRCACCKYSHRRYFDDHKHVVLKLIRSSQTVVACNPAKRWQVMGFATFEPAVLHWVHVKKFYRRQGVASDLLRHAGFKGAGYLDPIHCSHWSLGARNLAGGAWPLVYDPFILGGPKE